MNADLAVKCLLAVIVALLAANVFLLLSIRRRREAAGNEPHEKGDGLAWFVVATLPTLTVLVIFKGIPEGSSHDVVLMLMTAAVTGYGTVMSFKYGTTQNAMRKDTTIKDLATAQAVASSTAASIQTESVVAAATKEREDSASAVKIDAAVTLSAADPAT